MSNSAEKLSHIDSYRTDNSQYNESKRIDSEHMIMEEILSSFSKFSDGGGGGDMSKYVTTEVFEAHKEHMDTRFKESKDYIKDKFDVTENRLGSLDIKIDKLVNKDNSELNNLNSTISKLNLAVDTLNFSVGKMESKSTIIESAYNRLSDTNEELMNNFKIEVGEDTRKIKNDVIGLKDKMVTNQIVTGFSALAIVAAVIIAALI